MPFFQQYLVFAHVAVKMAIPEIFHFIIIIVFVMVICDQGSFLLLLQKDYDSLKTQMAVSILAIKYFLIKVFIFFI